MTALEIGGLSGGILAIILSLIQVSPIKFNPWTKIIRWFAKIFLGELFEKVENIQNDMNELKSTVAEDKAIECRVRILRFGDEVLHKERHTKEHFDQILRDITFYDNYCREHPDFENHITELTSSRIMKVYEKCCETADFL